MHTPKTWYNFQDTKQINHDQWFMAFGICHMTEIRWTTVAWKKFMIALQTRGNRLIFIFYVKPPACIYLKLYQRNENKITVSPAIFQKTCNVPGTVFMTLGLHRLHSAMSSGTRRNKKFFLVHWTLDNKGNTFFHNTRKYWPVMEQHIQEGQNPHLHNSENCKTKIQ